MVRHAVAILAVLMVVACTETKNTSPPGAAGGSVDPGGRPAGGSTSGAGGQAGRGDGGSAVAGAGGAGAAAAGGRGQGGKGRGGELGTGGSPTAGGGGGSSNGGSAGLMMGTGGSAAGGMVATGGASSAAGGMVASGGTTSQTGGTSASGGSTAQAGGSSGADGGASTGSVDGAGATGAKPSAGCGKARTLASGRINLQSGGLARSYILRVPESYDNTHPYRLVLAYHWRDATASDVANGGGTTEGPYFALWALANNSTIFLAPEGLDKGWANTDGQDVTFTDAIVAQVEADLCIDTSRVFAAGFSYGGAMSYALACARANVFRAVAAYSGALVSGCDGGTTPIPYFATRGVQEGGQASEATNGRALRDHMAEVNGCTAATPPEPASGSGKHICTTYQGCKPEYPVRWCAFDGGHTPSPKDQGQSKSWVPQETWDFFLQY